MADKVVQGLSADASRIPSKWNRQTVADGDWLQKKTLAPLSARDVYLAEQIDKGNSDVTYVSGKVNELSGKTLVLSGELNSTSSFLSGAIDSVSAGVDFVSAGVNSVSSIFDDFYTNEYEQFVRDVTQSANDLDEKIDDVAGDLADEIVNRTNADMELQNQIDKLEAATDVICVYGTYSGSENSFSNASGDLFKEPEHLTENDVIKILNDNSDTGEGGQTYWQATNVDWETSSCDWTRIGKLDPYYTKSEINTITANIASDISNTYLSAKGAVHQGNNIVVTEDSTKPEITISTSADVEFTTVSSVGFSGTNLSGATKHDTIDNLFGSAYSGASASAWIADNKTKIAYTADFKGTNNVVTGYGSSAFAGGISSISAKTGNSTALFTGYNVNLQAGEGVGFNYGTNLLTISAEGKTYADGNYIQISGNNNSINVTTPLVNSASSGYSAYDWITTKSATLQAGQGIGFYSAGPNILGISADGATYQDGNCISINENNEINLNDNVSATTFTTVTSNQGGYHGVTSAEMGKLYVSNWDNSYTDTTIINGAGISSKNTNTLGNNEILYITPYQVTATKQTNTAQCDWLHILSAGNGKFDELTANSISSQTLRLRGEAAQTTHTVDMNGWGFRYGGEGVDYTWWSKVADAASGIFEHEVSSNEGFYTETINGSVTNSTEIKPCSIEMISQGTQAGSQVKLTVTDLELGTSKIAWSDIFNFISGNGTIKKMVTATSVGSENGVVYLV